MSSEPLTRESIIDRVQKGVSLEGEKLKGIDLSHAPLQGARMHGAQFRYSDLQGADLSHADLRDANLRHANLKGANLSAADLTGADLTHSDVHGAIFTGAILKGTQFGDAKGISKKVFFPQQLLDQLLSIKENELDGEQLVIRLRGERWKLVAAARILAVEAGKDDLKLVHKILTDAELKKNGLQVYQTTAMTEDSDTVYRLEPGFVGEPLHSVKQVAAERIGNTTSSAVTPAPVSSPKEDKKSDQDLINEFLLKRLTSS